MQLIEVDDTGTLIPDFAVWIACLDSFEAGAIITIDQAIEAESFLDGAHFRNSIDKGDLEAGFKASDLVWEGMTYVIGQHAFPMEKQAALAVPEEKKGMTAPWCLLLTSIDHL